MKKTVGVFCSGGAWRGAYHNGFLNALKDNNVFIDEMVGVSAGFFAIFSHVAGVDSEDFWSKIDSPMYNNFHKKDVFSEFLDFYVPIVVKETKLSEDEIVKQMNGRCSAITKSFPNVFNYKRIKEFKSFEDIKNVTKATGSIPWFLSSFPHKFNDIKHVDGGFLLKNESQYLNSDIKIILNATTFKKDDEILYDKLMFTFNNKYPKIFKTLLWGNPNDYVKIWNYGYNDGLEFVKIYNKLMIND